MRLASRPILLAATLFLLLGVSPAAAQVKIGLITTLSGPGATLGQDQYDAFMLAVEQNGGKLGGVPVSVIRKDDQLKPDLGAQLAQELIEKDQVDLVTGVIFSNVMMAVYPRIVGSETIFIGSNAGPSPIAGAQCSPYFFSTSWTNDSLHENGGAVANILGYKNVYLMAPNYQAGRDAISGFKRLFEGTVVDEVYTQINQPDYSAEISQIQAARPEAVYVFYPGGMGVNFVKQYRQAGLMGRIPLISTSTIDGSTLPAIRDAAIGAITAAPWEPALDNPQTKTFVAAFTAKYGRSPSFYAAQSYDAAQLIASALEKTNGNVADKKAFLAALKQADFQSLRGDFRFDTNQFPITDWYMWEVVKNPGDADPSFAFRGKTLSEHRVAYRELCPME
ncbi:MAG: ABC transporter substrate-binding protein [Deferrisomatales bacterium]